MPSSPLTEAGGCQVQIGDRRCRPRSAAEIPRSSASAANPHAAARKKIARRVNQYPTAAIVPAASTDPMAENRTLRWVYGSAGDGVIAFTDFGIETLTGLIEIYKANPHLLKRPPDPR